ncbi:hypothetical protein IWQ62_002087 [Dispira parvispora]|uniref:RlpA-like protein double-psi beta-barrel domain-containing protein n=1 Tax=Dispira parvispora TaxID=1520584 RepID=A0A9W8E8C7_9FUNG|nr:hypothetical protein IWQ62_002087 [Dispira parvispora]
MVRCSVLALAAIAMISIPAVMAAPVAPESVSLTARDNRKCKPKLPSTPTETLPAPTQSAPIRDVEVKPDPTQQPEILPTSTPTSTTAVNLPTGTPTTPPPGNQSGNSGEATFYTPGTGSCGGNNSGTEFVAALSAQYMQNSANPNNNSHCGSKIRVTGASGKSVDVTVVDTCPECAMYDVDMSPEAFNAIANPVDGRVPVTWTLL